MTRTGAAARPPLDERAETAFDWIRGNLKYVGIAAAVIVVGFLGTVFYSRSRRANEAAAERQLYTAEQEAESGNAPLAISDLTKLITRYGGTRAATAARIELARLQYSQGKYAEGLKTIDDISSPGAAKPVVLALRAAGLEQQNKATEAAEAYLQAADAAVLRADKDQYRAEAARVFATAGKTDRAREIWSQLATDPSSTMTAEARVRLGELTARAAARG